MLEVFVVWGKTMESWVHGKTIYSISNVISRISFPLLCKLESLCHWTDFSTIYTGGTDDSVYYCSVCKLVIWNLHDWNFISFKVIRFWHLFFLQKITDRLIQSRWQLCRTRTNIFIVYSCKFIQGSYRILAISPSVWTGNCQQCKTNSPVVEKVNKVVSLPSQQESWGLCAKYLQSLMGEYFKYCRILYPTLAMRYCSAASSVIYVCSASCFQCHLPHCDELQVPCVSSAMCLQCHLPPVSFV